MFGITKNTADNIVTTFEYLQNINRDIVFTVCSNTIYDRDFDAKFFIGYNDTTVTASLTLNGVIVDLSNVDEVFITSGNSCLKIVAQGWMSSIEIPIIKD